MKYGDYENIYESENMQRILKYLEKKIKIKNYWGTQAIQD